MGTRRGYAATKPYVEHELAAARREAKQGLPCPPGERDLLDLPRGGYAPKPRRPIATGDTGLEGQLTGPAANDNLRALMTNGRVILPAPQ